VTSYAAPLTLRAAGLAYPFCATLGGRTNPVAFRRYQDDLETPGISPRNANPRKQRRQMPNLRRKARGRPQIWQRLCLREENLGFRASLTRFAVVAKLAPGSFT